MIFPGGYEWDPYWLEKERAKLMADCYPYPPEYLKLIDQFEKDDKMDRKQKLLESIEYCIRQTNACLYKWHSEAQVKHSKISLITQQDVRGLFINFFKKVITDVVRDEVTVSRFLSWHKPMITLEGITGQIQNVSFMAYRDYDHPLFKEVKEVMSFITYHSLTHANSLQKPKEIIVELKNDPLLDEVSKINFDSINDIVF